MGTDAFARKRLALCGVELNRVETCDDSVMGRLVGFEPTTSRITIWRYYQLSYSRREISFYHFSPARLHISSTRFEIPSGMRITSGHGRVNPSSGHFFVASMPIFEP